jgi:hypothetical protein
MISRTIYTCQIRLEIDEKNKDSRIENFHRINKTLFLFFLEDVSKKHSQEAGAFLYGKISNAKID